MPQTSFTPIDDANSVMGFGRHKGKHIYELIAEDPEYLEWAHENVDRFKLSPRLMRDVRNNISSRVRDDDDIPF